MTKTKYRNDHLEALHKTAAVLADVGALDKATMRDLDAFVVLAASEKKAEPKKRRGFHPVLGKAAKDGL